MTERDFIWLGVIGVAVGGWFGFKALKALAGFFKGLTSDLRLLHDTLKDIGMVPKLIEGQTRVAQESVNAIVLLEKSVDKLTRVVLAGQDGGETPSNLHYTEEEAADEVRVRELVDSGMDREEAERTREIEKKTMAANPAI